MNSIEIRDLCLIYENSDTPTLTIERLDIPEGQFVLVVGKSGSGKSSFLNCINGVVPHLFPAEVSGIKVKGRSCSEMKISEISKSVGTLLQDPEMQVLNYGVDEEIAFGPENLMLDPDEIKRRLSEAIEHTGISEILGRDTYSLSGGELQRVALASVLAMEPEILLLDEPTSNIDQEGTNLIFDSISRLKGKKTIIIIEHKVDRVLTYADRIILINNGRIEADFPKSEFSKYVPLLIANGIEVPSRFLARNNSYDPYPSKRRTFDGSQFLVETMPIALSADIAVSYNRKPIVNTTVQFPEKCLLAIMGKNGAGKSTILKAITGTLENNLESDISLTIKGERITKVKPGILGRYVGYLPQTFDTGLVRNTVEKEILYSLKARKTPDMLDKLESILSDFSLQEQRDMDPLSLSFGQRRRVAIASVIASGPKIVLLDEPTSGQDFYHKEMLAKDFRIMKDSGITVVAVTHDANLVLRHFERLVLINEGSVAAYGIPGDIFQISANFGVRPPEDFFGGEVNESFY